MKYFIVIALFFITHVCYSQNFINRAGAANTVIDQRLGAAQNFFLPRLADTTLSGGLDTIGNLIYDRLRAKIAIRDTVLTGGHKFTFLFKTEDTLTTLATRYDLTQLSGDNISNASLTANGNYAQNWNNKQWYVDSITSSFLFRMGGVGNTGTRRKEFRINWGGSAFGDGFDAYNMLASIKKGDNSADSLTLGLRANAGVLSMGFYNEASPTNNTFISYNSTNGLINIQARDSIWIKGATPAATADSILAVVYRSPTASRIVKIPLTAAGGGATLNNIGTGFAWLATPSGDFKRVANSNTILWDSTSTANSLTAKVDTSIIATQYDLTQVIPSLTATQVAFGGPPNTMTSEAAFNYISATNKLNVDSVDLIQSRQDSAFFVRQAGYLSTDTLLSSGNSITDGLNASPVEDSAYVYRLSARLGLAIDNIAISGTGMVSIANRHLINKNPGNTVMSTVMGGLNDVRRNGADRKTLNKDINGHKAIFVNHNLKSFTNAGTGGVGVTRNGSWVDSWDARAEGGKTTVGAYTSSAGAYIEFTGTDSTFVFGLMGGDGSGASYIGTDIQVSIDGTPVDTINTNDQTDGVADGSGLDNKRCAMAFMYGNLSFASHTIRLTKLSTGGGGFMICDYFGHLVPRTEAYLLMWFHAPYLTEVGYLTSPANATNAIIDTLNSKIDSLASTDFVSWYSTLVVETNNCYDTTSGTSVDGIHPNNTGHGQIDNCAMNTINSANGGGGTTGKIYYSDEFHGIVEGVDEILLTLRKADARYILNQTEREQVANYRISGTGTAAKFTSDATVFGTGLTIADRQTNGVVAGAAAGNVFLEMRNNSGATDGKSYGVFLGSNGYMFRLLSDDLSTETRIFEVLRTGMVADTIRMPKLDITTGPLKVYAHAIAADSDSAVVWNRTTNAYEYAKINDRVETTTSSAGTLTLSNSEFYCFNGTTTTWTLPAVSGTTGVIYYIKNIGTGSITLNADSGNNEIYSSSAVNTITVTAGSAIILISNNTYWTVN